MTNEMRDSLAEAEAAAGPITGVKLMRATGAARVNVRTWLQCREGAGELGRRPLFSAGEDNIIADYLAAWTKGGDVL